MTTNSKSLAELKSDRQELIEGWNQHKLREATVFVAGVGALGNEVAKNLAQAGVGGLTIIDMDKIEYSNLNRTVLFSNKEVGQKKAFVAAETLKSLAPDVKVQAYDNNLEDFLERSPNAFEQIDLIAGCLDNMEARFLLNHISVFNRIPLVDGGMVGFGGSVQVVIPPYTPCLECNAPKEAYANIGKRFSCTVGDYVDLTEAERRVRVPSVPTMTSIIAALQAQEALKILLGLENFRKSGTWPHGIGKPLENAIQYDGRTNGTMIMKLKKNPACYVCGREFESSGASFFRKEVVAISPNESLSDIKKKIAFALGKEKVNLVSGLSWIPDRREIQVKLRRVQLKLNFLARGLITHTSGKEAGGQVRIDQPIFRVYSSIRELSRSVIFQETQLEEKTNGIEKLLHLIDRLKDIATEMQVEERRLISPVIEELSRDIEELRRYLSGDVPLSELGMHPVSDVYAIDQNDATTRTDTLIVLVATA